MNDSLIRRYHNKGILIDTNILLLFLVGSVNQKRIVQFKRTQQFTPEDYQLLLRIINEFSLIITTPNILTEVNSLANQLGEPERSECFTMFARFVENVDFLNEHYIKSQEAVSIGKFVKFGLTDCGILTLAKGKYLVLTDDLKLANYLQNVGVDVINFNNLRVFD